MTDALKRLLDQATPPPPPAGFAERIAARALAHPQEPGAAASTGRDRRGPWLRRRGVSAFVAANLLVASAVAATIAGGGLDLPPLREVPVIAPVLQAIAPRPKPRPEPERTRPIAARPAPVAEPAPPSAPPPAVRAAPRIERALERRERLAEIVRAREAAGLPVTERAQRRAALTGLERQAYDQWSRGEAVPLELKTEIARERLDLAPPRVRERVIERVEARREAGLPVAPALDAAVPPAPATTVEPPPAPERAQRWRQLSPAQRQQVLDRLRARRASRLQARRP